MADPEYILVGNTSSASAYVAIDADRGIREITAQAVESAVKLPVGMLVANFEAFFKSIAGLVDVVPDGQSKFRIEEIEFAAEITGEGELKLIGGVKAGLKGGITIKLKRNPANQAPDA